MLGSAKDNRTWPRGDGLEGDRMRYKLSRLLQLLGLVIPAVGIAGNLVQPEEYGVSYTLKMAALGIAVFYVGWLLQKGRAH